MTVYDYSQTAALNTAISSINIDEGCAPANVNNALRQLMADVAQQCQPMTRAQFVTAVSGGRTWSSGAIVFAGERLYIQMPSGHALYGTDPISDLPGFAAYQVWTPEHNGTTGTANDTSVVDAASAAAATAGMELHFEGKTYRGSFKLQNNGVWKGVKGQTTLRIHESAGSTQSTAYFNTNTTDGRLTNFHAEGIIFHGSKSDNTGETALLIWGFDNISFKDCVFTDAETYCFAAQARPGHTQSDVQDGLTMTNCQFNNAGTNGGSWDGCDIKYGTNMQFINCRASGCTNAGFNIRGEATIDGLICHDNDVTNIRFQATDLSGGYPSKFTVSGLRSGATAGKGIQIKGAALNPTTIVGDMHAHDATGVGIEISGDGISYGSINIVSEDNGSHGLHLTGDFCGGMVVDGLITGNAGDGVLIAAAGQNLHFSGLATGNTGTNFNDGGSNNSTRTWP